MAGIFHERHEIEAVDIGDAVIAGSGDDHDGSDDDEDGHMGPENLPDALGDAGDECDSTAAVEGRAEGDRRRHSRLEHKHLGRVGKAKARRNPERPAVAWNVRQKDDQQYNSQDCIMEDRTVSLVETFLLTHAAVMESVVKENKVLIYDEIDKE